MNDKSRKQIRGKMSPVRHLLRPAAILVLALGLSMVASGRGVECGTYPSKSIDLIVPFNPGGASDMTARIAQPFLIKKLGQTINVVNKPGGASAVGATYVLTSPPDGYTILLHSFANTTVPAIQPDAPYKWDDPTPLGLLMFGPLVFAVPADSPYKTLKDVLDALKKNPGEIKYGAGGIGSPSIVGIYKLLQAEGIDPARVGSVQFNGSGPTLAAVAGGHVAFSAESVGGTIPLVQAGKLRALAISSPTRFPEFPDLPTGKELGYPQFSVMTWNGFSGPPKLPDAVVKKWSEAIKEASEDPEVIKRFRARKAIVMYKSPAEFKELWEDQYTTLRSMHKK
jgi:tripartite-type tricarboxylate transporter receptor subunit TctC